MLKWIKSLFSPSSFKDSPPHNEPSIVEVSGDEFMAALDRVMVEHGTTLKRLGDAKWPETLAELTDANPKRPREHFTWHEVACLDKARTLPPSEILQNVYAAADMMERIRALFGGAPITVNSWYRSSEYNRQVGGAKNSQHVMGGAVDFTVAGFTPAQVQRKVRANAGKLGVKGLGCYKGFTHCDIGVGRKRYTEWNG